MSVQSEQASSASALIPPPVRHELIFCPAAKDGEYIVKDPTRGAYFQIGEREYFLVRQFNGIRGDRDIRSAYEARFAEPLSRDDLKDFVKLASRQRWVLESAPGEHGKTSGDASASASPSAGTLRSVLGKQSLLNFRVRFFDPDRVLNWLNARTGFIWTHAFLVATLALIMFAMMIGYTHRAQWISTFPEKITWNTVVLVWCAILVATLLHEFAHGLACKHFGGEVHEIGFLLMFFVPCLYCNVSDAWLFRERSKRLWTGVAGTYCDLLIWALATCAWRLTRSDTSINYLAWILSSVCGGRCFFNFNPLLKLDGYYLLGDLVGIHNLSDRGRKRWFQTLRWILWGAPRPPREERGWFLLGYGFGSWFFIASLFSGMLFGLLRLQESGVVKASYFKVGLSVMMVYFIGKNILGGLFDKEFGKMLAKRRGRVLGWTLGGIVAPIALSLIPIREKASGTFVLRPSTRIEVNALVAGFLRDISVEEGTRVSPGTQLARIEIPDLEVNLAKKRAEIQESQANLRRLEAGPRPEQIVEQRLRVQRAMEWRDLGQRDLRRAEECLKEELVRLDRQIARMDAAVELSRQTLKQAQKLISLKAMSKEQYLGERMNAEVSVLELEQAEAEKRACQARGTSQAEAELARREKELADERSALTLLESGGHPEEVEAERARLARLNEELKYLELLQGRVQLTSSVTGVVTTARMREKAGQFVPQGAVVCVIEELTDVMAEISITEEDEFDIQPGQRVDLRARAMPFRPIQATVERKAPSAVMAEGHTQGTVKIYCRLAQVDAEMLSGMTGHAKICHGYRPIGTILFCKVFKFLRTEFWFW